METKRIALFMDGTWNEPGSKTNIRKLHKACLKTDDQITAYYCGVGGGLKKWYNPTKVAALLGGWGISDIIKSAYRIIAEKYKPGITNIFIFGFSRGAYAARSLVGFLDKIGMIQPQYIDLIPVLYDKYMKNDLSAYEWKETLRKDGWLRDNEWRKIQVYFIGVWDTVGRLGVPIGAGINKLNPYVNFHNTDLPNNVTHAYHALAIHELRSAFRPCLWTKRGSDTETLEQVWFVGDHADVGGGHEKPSGLSDNSLSWMAAKAICKGLDVNKCRIPSEPMPNAAIHCRLLDAECKIMRRKERKIQKSDFQGRWNRSDKEFIDNAWDTIGIHKSVIESWKDPMHYDRYPTSSGAINKSLVKMDSRACCLFMEKTFKEKRPLADEKCTPILNQTHREVPECSKNDWWEDLALHDVSEYENRLKQALSMFSITHADPSSPLQINQTELLHKKVALWSATLLGLERYQDIKQILEGFINEQQRIRNYLETLKRTEQINQIWRPYIRAIKVGLECGLHAFSARLSKNEYDEIWKLINTIAPGELTLILTKKRAPETKPLKRKPQYPEV